MAKRKLSLQGKDFEQVLNLAFWGTKQLEESTLDEIYEETQNDTGKSTEFTLYRRFYEELMDYVKHNPNSQFLIFTTSCPKDLGYLPLNICYYDFDCCVEVWQKFSKLSKEKGPQKFYVKLPQYPWPTRIVL